jgi:cobalt-precorrin 5A hydrolase / precorrin-3B C17-methyltransferase
MTAIVILNQASLPLARRVQAALSNGTVYGLASRTETVDVAYANFGETVRDLFQQGIPMIGICAAGILIRTLAPLLTDKWQEPPVIALAEDGSAVVPLLGGLHGVNDLARQIAAMLNVPAAITTSGDLRFRTALLAPPNGYRLANPDDAKTLIADLLSGKTVRLEGHAPWIQQSQLPLADTAPLTLQVTVQTGTPSPTCLVYHPATLVIGCYRPPSDSVDEIRALLQQANLAPQAIAGMVGLNQVSDVTSVQTIAQTLQVPARFFNRNQLGGQIDAAALALNAVNQGELLIQTDHYAVVAADQPLQMDQIGQAQGRLTVVGVGPGSAAWMSPEARSVLKAATDWVGYTTYLNLAEPLRTHQQRHDSDNREELERARAALDLAATGRSVAVISSGDPGIYAMAAAIFEVLDTQMHPTWETVEVQVCPGISAMQAAAAQVGAPLGHDFCAISLSDILKSWSVIVQRITAAATADLAIAFYNPVSKTRTWQLAEAKQILLQFRQPQTPVVLARNLGRPGQAVQVIPLGDLQPEAVDMRTVVLVGSSQTRLVARPDGQCWVYTPRHYREGDSSAV